MKPRELPASSAVRTPRTHCHGLGSAPAQGTEIDAAKRQKAARKGGSFPANTQPRACLLDPRERPHSASSDMGRQDMLSGSLSPEVPGRRALGRVLL